MENSAKLLKHQLGSIDLSDIEELKEIKLKDNEAAARAGDVETFYKAHFEKVLKLFIQKQLEFIGTEAIDMDKLTFGRGTINGFMLIKEWMERESNRSLSRFDKSEEETDTGLPKL